MRKLTVSLVSFCVASGVGPYPGTHVLGSDYGLTIPDILHGAGILLVYEKWPLVETIFILAIFL